MNEYDASRAGAIHSAQLMHGWPFLVAYDRATLEAYWRDFALKVSRQGFANSSLVFETATSSLSGFYASSTLGDLRLQLDVDETARASLVVKRRFLDAAHLQLSRSVGAATRLITEIRRINEAQGVDLCLKIPLGENVGQYDGQQVALSWAGSPCFYLEAADEGLDDSPLSLCYALYFKGLPRSEQQIVLAESVSQAGKVLEPVQFVMRLANDPRLLVLHPTIAGETAGVFPPDYALGNYLSNGQTGILLDGSRYPFASLNESDVRECPSLFMPAHAVRGCSLSNSGGVVVGKYDLEVPPAAQSAPIKGRTLEPLFKVLNRDQGATFHLLPASPESEVPEWLDRDDGLIEADGWRCHYRPRQGAARDLGQASPGVGLKGLWEVSEVDHVEAVLDGEHFISWVVVLHQPPNGYIRSTGMSDGKPVLKLCYVDKSGEEQEVPLDSTTWVAQNCDVSDLGVMTHWGSERLCIIRAYHEEGDNFIWAILIVPYPLLEMSDALKLGIA
jgi:hypothetical protein